MAYQIYQEQFESERFDQLRDMGAHPQRVLWASTGTKNPAYSDVKYVDALVGRDTINTMPMKTLLAYRDHGQPALRLTEDQEHARAVLRDLAPLSIDLDTVTRRLEDEGVHKFNAAYDKLLLVFATGDARHLERQRRWRRRQRRQTLGDSASRETVATGRHDRSTGHYAPPH